MPPTGYFDPFSLYGSPFDYSTAPIVGGPGGYLANTPQAAWTRALGTWGLGQGNDPFSSWVRNQYGRSYGGFQAAAATNPNLGFGYGTQDYLKMLGPDFFRNQWRGLSAEQRGLNQPRYGAGRVQWGRSY